MKISFDVKQWHWSLRLLGFIISLILFILSIQAMGKAFPMMGKDFANGLIEAISNPFSALFTGILSTAIIQSSSSTTSIMVGLVSSGVIQLEFAIPFIMGANIGTTITNTIVSLGQIAKKDEFKLAFAASTVHDIFNMLTVIILFPLELNTGFLFKTSTHLSTYFGNFGGFEMLNPIHIMANFCITGVIDVIGKQHGWGLLILSLIMLLLSLNLIVIFMKSILLSKAESRLEEMLFGSKFKSFLFGLILTAFVQSSSVTTSLVVPLAGLGVLSIARVFPYSLGANIGTTVTALMAAFAAGTPAGLSLAFSHLLFNVTGVLIFWKLQFIPIWLARKLSGLVYNRRWLALVYLFVFFVIVPITMIAVFD